jgi:FtsH-binding integral membrane protein
MRRAAWLLLLDLCCVLAFTVIGRASHAEADGVAGQARTAWPFLAGLAVGVVASRAWRRPESITGAGIAVWLATVAVGMLLRVVSGQGTAVAFIAVALIFLGLTMLGWRLVARWVTGRSAGAAKAGGGAGSGPAARFR